MLTRSSPLALIFGPEAAALLEEGVPIRLVSKLLGHSSTRITEAVYSHATARLAEESAKALDRAL